MKDITEIILWILFLVLIIVFVIIGVSIQTGPFEYIDINGNIGYSNYCYTTRGISRCNINEMNTMVQGYRKVER